MVHLNTCAKIGTFDLNINQFLVVTPFYQIILYLNIFIILFVPIISVYINYKIFKIITIKTSNINCQKFKEYKRLFKAITVQSIFPFIFQVPAIVYILYYATTRHQILGIEMTLNCFYYTGNGFCIFLSMVIIKEFKLMMLKDFGCIKKVNFTYTSYMTLVMSFEFFFASLVHVIYNGYMIFYKLIDAKVHLVTCSKLNILDLNINQLLIVTPFYFNIFRFYKIIFNKSPNIIFMIGIIFITLAPILYMMGGQFFEINAYFLIKPGCGYQIFSNIPYYQLLMYTNVILVLFLPIISFILNYIIYKITVKRTAKTNKSKIHHINSLFKGIAIQSLFPLFCQVPAIIYTIYFTIFRKNITSVEIIISCIYFPGQGICIFLSMIVINEFKNMMLTDFKISKKKLLINHSIINTKVKSNNFI
uniref:G-protein coupled receptors family 1 profile domain-containing protein n=1 Tax=Strongyloides stercoralis TaxID=6248 RepID=A0A0K0ERQ3_STRER